MLLTIGLPLIFVMLATPACLNLAKRSGLLRFLGVALSLGVLGVWGFLLHLAGQYFYAGEPATACLGASLVAALFKFSLELEDFRLPGLLDQLFCLNMALWLTPIALLGGELAWKLGDSYFNAGLVGAARLAYRYGVACGANARYCNARLQEIDSLNLPESLPPG